MNGSVIKNHGYDSIRLAQTNNLDTWIDFVKSSGEIKVFKSFGSQFISINSIKSDIFSNKFYVMLSLRGNQLVTFYNCNINDAVMLEDASLANRLLSSKTIGVNGNGFL